MRSCGAGTFGRLQQQGRAWFRKRSELREALDGRDLIGQAKGVVMATRRVTADQAVEMLRDASQRNNIKLRALGEQVSITGEIPGAEA